LKGLVVRSTGSWFIVRNEMAEIIPCKIKGTFRIKGIKTTNPVAVGDRVEFNYYDDEKFGIITKINKRDNYIIRKATKLSKLYHIIAANLDQVFLVATLARPRTSTGFIDRFLVTAEAYHIPANIIFNKIDIYNEDLWNSHKHLSTVYTKAGYGVFEVSAIEGDGIEVLKDSLKGKVSLFAGHSGVGKTALLNTLEPGLNLKVAPISEAHEKGKHTTTFAEMFELSWGGFIIDTPGIKEFGLTDFYKFEVAERFPEMRALMHQCQFHNCTHTHEPKCAVKEALSKGLIDPDRYKNYLSILSDDWD